MIGGIGAAARFKIRVQATGRFDLDQTQVFAGLVASDGGGVAATI
jgi:hypothetical protein